MIIDQCNCAPCGAVFHSTAGIKTACKICETLPVHFYMMGNKVGESKAIWQHSQKNYTIQNFPVGRRPAPAQLIDGVLIVEVL